MTDIRTADTEPAPILCSESREDFDAGCHKLELALLAIECANNHDQVRNAVDAARQALMIIACSAETLWPE